MDGQVKLTMTFNVEVMDEESWQGPPWMATCEAAVAAVALVLSEHPSVRLNSLDIESKSVPIEEVKL